jgi:hypothetical protein
VFTSDYSLKPRKNPQIFPPESEEFPEILEILEIPEIPGNSGNFMKSRDIMQLHQFFEFPVEPFLLRL